MADGIDQAKGFFFDREKVLDAAEKASRKAESRFAAFVRTKARSSIRRRKKVSEPGSPPSAHGDLLKMIFFGRTPAGVTVVGPVRLSKPGLAPRTLEKGGSETLKGKTRLYRPRPFMGPALASEAPKFAEQFRGEVHG